MKQMHPRSATAPAMTPLTTGASGHGVNIGFGFTKYLVIVGGEELDPIVFPSQIARAGRATAGSIAEARTVAQGDDLWWVGDDARLGAPLALLSQARLADPAFVPVLLRGALQRLPHGVGSAGAVCVTGLPATWSEDDAQCDLLGERIRAAGPGYRSVRAVSEVLGLAYSLLLDNHGRIAGDAALRDGRWAVADWGHNTDDYATIDHMRQVKNSAATFQTGAARALQTVRQRLASAFDRDFSLYETAAAIRAGYVQVGAQRRALPLHWDAPLIEAAEQTASTMVELYGSGSALDGLIVGGGGAYNLIKLDRVRASYPHHPILVPPEAQTAIARGYARLAVRLAREGR